MIEKQHAKFIGWKIAELSVYVAGYPFLFVGAWTIGISDWCGDRARRHKQLIAYQRPEKQKGNSK